MSATPFSPDNSREATALLFAERLRAEARARAGAEWFFWVGGLSLASLAFALTWGGERLPFALGVTRVVEPIATRSGISDEVVGLLMTTAIAVTLLLCGVFARRGERWAFWLGFGIYALDGLFWAVAPYWSGIIFHALALLLIYRGLAAVSRLRELETSEATA